MNKGEPIFKSVFGKDWESLPPVMRRHYANRAFQEDRSRAEGFLDVVSSPLGRCLNPFLRLAKILVPYEGTHIPVSVDFISSTVDATFTFDRVFRFPGRVPVRFTSRLIPQHGSEVIERMNWGFCWCCTYTWTGEKIILAHKGYALDVGGKFLPLPLDWLIGKGYAEETPLNEEEFSMFMEVRHPLFGKIMGYGGTFRMTQDCP